MDSSNGTMTTKETAATEAATMATAIPIECGDKSSSADNAIPEWDAIEINGQLVLPQLGLDGGNEKENDDNHQVELGAVDFVNGVCNDPLVSFHCVSSVCESHSLCSSSLCT